MRRIAQGPGLPGPFSIPRILVGGCAALALGAAAAPGDALRVELTSDHHSDPLSLAQFGSDEPLLISPRAGRNLVYLRDEVRTSAPLAGGQLALLARQAATLVASPGTVTVASDLDTAGSPATSAHHAVRLRYTGFAGWGLAWRTGSTPGIDLADPAPANAWLAAPGWHWQAGVQALQLQRLIWRRIDGQVSFDAATAGYSFGLESDRGDNRLKLPFEQPYAATGAAVLLDAQLMHCDIDRCLGAGVRDLGRLRWRGLPREQATLSTQTQAVDADGYLIYKPLVQGLDSQPDVSRAAPVSVNVDARWPLAPGWHAALRAEWLAAYGWLPAARVQWQGASGPAWAASWQVHERRLGLQASGERWVLGYATDKFGAGAHTRELRLALNWPLD